MDIVERLRKRDAIWLSVGWDNNDIFDEAADEIERLRRDVEEANARAYIMAKEITLWQSQAALKEGE